MERVEGFTGGRFYYLYLGFIYILSHIRGAVTYVKCQVARCPGTGSFTDEAVATGRDHNHGPDVEAVEMIRFKNDLRRLARESADDYRRIYDDTSLRYPNAARAYAFPAAAQMMQRIRRAYRPPQPTSLMNLQDTLRHPSWRKWGLDLGSQDFFRETLVAVDGTECAVFVSHTFSDLVRREGWHAHADGTFKAVPLHPAVEQLFTLHVIDDDAHGQQKQLYPVAYALMTRRTTDAYEAVLRCVCRHVDGMQTPADLMADFEPALRGAFRRVWPDVDVKGCWFHFGQAVLHRALDVCHLKNLFQENALAGRVQKMLMAVPLLPMNLIVSGIDCIERYAARHDLADHFVAMIQYMRTYWINEVRE
ncbi:UvrABC system protein C [Frankliniella fusca]|uniref:UvrABC system protein C n=1 Tax=Frankliniella fusca TaxID=407009 RepID=A0AAE1HPH6_9NEOP|nr:UvrABC system protein C [Frankliniella fusca]